jgi:LAO/AO transport system kinase
MTASSKPPLDRRALGRALTRIANGELDAAPAAALGAAVAWRIGITGAPGAGKSTLTGRLALLRLASARVGVLAIDPSSPVSGGAILGDRIRMDDLAGVEDLFIRSFGSRSAADGLADHVSELLAAMDAAGFDEVLLETVGVGQAELAVRSQVDTLVVVVPPDAGDAIQAMKAGIAEIGDIFAVNKADLPTAPRMAGEIERIVGITHRAAAGVWVPPVLLTSQARPDTITALSAQVDRHREWVQASGMQRERQLARARYRLSRWLERRLAAGIDAAPADLFEQPLAEQARVLLQRLAAGEVP